MAAVKYRKKPIVIEAVQWTGGNWAEVAEFTGLPDTDETEIARQMAAADGRVRIRTLEGVMAASPGDWIIRGVQGEFYPCNPGIFAATYELAEDVQEIIR